MKRGKFVGRGRIFYEKSDAPVTGNEVRVQFRGTEARLLQHLENEGIPCEHPVIAEEGMGWVSGEVLLAGRK